MIQSTLSRLGLSIVLITTLLSGCTTTPQKSSSQFPTAVINNLRKQPMPRSLPIPVQGVNKKQLTDTWGAARGNGRRHEGIDILAPRNTKVTSTTNGVVMSLKNNKLGGRVIWIIGPAGAWHYYAHLQRHKAGLSEGDIIKQGQVIGFVGNSGNARNTVTHLHYGIYTDGKGKDAINPYPYLKN